jgi:DNA primase small subunit
VVSRDFVREKFSEYYKYSSGTINPPLLFDQREFGFFLLKEKVMLRHKRFSKKTDLNSFLSEAVPSDVYHSCAYYENPDFEMSKKGWLGADLVFDIDADHIPTPCNKIHDEWSCGKCGFAGKGITPEVCPVCGGVKFETKTWPCELCLQSAKEETEKLIAMLKEDFGFSPKEIHVFFSGHRGYHVHVETDSVRTLDAAARKEVVDYVSGIGFMRVDEEIEEERPGRQDMRFLDFQNFGWRRRLKMGMEKFVMNATKEDLKAIWIRNYNVLKKREEIIKKCFEEGRWDSVKGVNVETWRRLARHVRDLESAKIDTVVTTDLHRLIRMAGTLHGKTGLLKVEFPTSRIASFEPFKEAVAFKKGTARVAVSSAPEFRLNEEVFGPYRNQTVELPTAAAVLLVCKGRAEVLPD